MWVDSIPRSFAGENDIISFKGFRADYFRKFVFPAFFRWRCESIYAGKRLSCLRKTNRLELDFN